ncbi:MAG: tetratricopeptide repeat protein [Desulfobacterales bacterium]
MADETTKRGIPEPDEEPLDPLQRLQNRVRAFALAWKKQLAAAAAIICVAAIAGGGVFYFLERARENASEMLIQATRHYDSLGQDPGEDELEGVRQDFENLIDTYGYTGPGKTGLLQYAAICYKAEDYDRALELYENARESFGESSGFGRLALNGMAHSNAAMGENEKAVALFEKLLEDESPALKDQALFNLGELYSRSGDTEKSRKYYQQLVSEFPDSIFAEPAGDRLPG